jgi:hypothetical protein
MSSIHDALRFLGYVARDYEGVLQATSSARVLQSDATSLTLFAGYPPTAGLPTWNTHAFVGVAANRWIDDDLDAACQELAVRDGAVSSPATARIIVHIPAGAGSLLVDSWAGMLRAIDTVLTTMLLMRLLVRVGVRRRAGVDSFLLILIATCRRYGRRSEPDDHASLFIRRQPMSMGSFTLAC